MNTSPAGAAARRYPSPFDFARPRLLAWSFPRPTTRTLFWLVVRLQKFTADVAAAQDFDNLLRGPDLPGWRMNLDGSRSRELCPETWQLLRAASVETIVADCLNDIEAIAGWPELCGFIRAAYGCSHPTEGEVGRAMRDAAGQAPAGHAERLTVAEAVRLLAPPRYYGPEVEERIVKLAGVAPLEPHRAGPKRRPPGPPPKYDRKLAMNVFDNLEAARRKAGLTHVLRWKKHELVVAAVVAFVKDGTCADQEQVWGYYKTHQQKTASRVSAVSSCQD